MLLILELNMTLGSHIFVLGKIENLENLISALIINIDTCKLLAFIPNEEVLMKIHDLDFLLSLLKVVFNMLSKVTLWNAFNKRTVTTHSCSLL